MVHSFLLSFRFRLWLFSVHINNNNPLWWGWFLWLFFIVTVFYFLLQCCRHWLYFYRIQLNYFCLRIGVGCKVVMLQSLTWLEKLILSINSFISINEAIAHASSRHQRRLQPKTVSHPHSAPTKTISKNYHKSDKIENNNSKVPIIAMLNSNISDKEKVERLLINLMNKIYKSINLILNFLSNSKESNLSHIIPQSTILIEIPNNQPIPLNLPPDAKS